VISTVTVTPLPGGDVMSLSGLLDNGSHSMPEYGGDHLGRRPKGVLFQKVAKLFGQTIYTLEPKTKTLYSGKEQLHPVKD
jgi:hypothetical protein